MKAQKLEGFSNNETGFLVVGVGCTDMHDPASEKATRGMDWQCQSLQAVARGKPGGAEQECVNQEDAHQMHQRSNQSNIKRIGVRSLTILQFLCC